MTSFTEPSIAVFGTKRTMSGSPFVLVAMFVLVAVQAIPETSHLIQTDQDGRIIHLDVTVDADEKTVLANVGDVSQYSNSVQTVNFHDYKTGYGVLKIVNKKVCVLARALVPMKKPEDYRVGSTGEVHAHSLRIAPDKISQKDVEVIAGPRIASFCQDYATYFTVATPIDDKLSGNSTIEVSRSARSGRAAHQAAMMWCVFSRCDSDADILSDDSQ